MADNELLHKLRARRCVVDTEGTSWASKPDAASPEKAKTPGPSPSGGLRKAVTVSFPATGAPSAGSNAEPSELSKRLNSRRNVVDSEGSTWDKTDFSARSSCKTDLPLDSAKFEVARCAVSKETSSTGPSELFRRLNSRRSVVDSEGSTWENADPACKSVASSRKNSGQSERSPKSGGFTIPGAPGGLVGGAVAALQRAAEAPSEGVNSASAARVAECSVKEVKVAALRRAAESRWRTRVEDGFLSASVLRELAGGSARVALWRGTRTWLCEVWMCENGTAVAAQPAVICMTTSGEVLCCVPAPSPPGVDEEVEYARVLTSLCAASLHCIGTSPSHTLAFYLDAEDWAVLARFDSAAEAASCASAAAALGGEARAVAVVERTPTMMEVDGSAAEDLLGLWPDATNGHSRSIVADEPPRPYFSESAVFLRELDEIAGFA